MSRGRSEAAGACGITIPCYSVCPIHGAGFTVRLSTRLRPSRRWPPASPCRWGGFARRVIGIDDALCGPARCRGVALWQRRVGAFKVIVIEALIDLQADRISGVIGLGPSRRRHQNRCRNQDCQSWNAHPSLLESLEQRPRTRDPVVLLPIIHATAAGQQSKKWPFGGKFHGERGGTRTLDPMIKSHVLYHLSYALTWCAV
jgi:hypothetical protein